jgi:hypothetical protein
MNGRGTSYRNINEKLCYLLLTAGEFISCVESLRR